MYGEKTISGKYKNFCCPICGNKNYEQVTQSDGVIGPGGRSWVTHFICSGCSVQFQDAEKFTKSKKA